MAAVAWNVGSFIRTLKHFLIEGRAQNSTEQFLSATDDKTSVARKLPGWNLIGPFWMCRSFCPITLQLFFFKVFSWSGVHFPNILCTCAPPRWIREIRLTDMWNLPSGVSGISACIFCTFYFFFVFFVGKFSQTLPCITFWVNIFTSSSSSNKASIRPFSTA